ncbi:MAG: hypothetical protein ACRDD1_18855 [Planctomycetia bacterium]
MMTADQILAKLFELRKDYKDDPEDPLFQALDHACLFVSYRMGDFRKYCDEAAEREKEGGRDED